MKHIPHDYYLKFVDDKIFEDVLNFHSKGNFTLHECVRNISVLHNLHPQTLENLTGNELHLYPDMGLTIQGDALQTFPLENPLHRDESCRFFKDVPIEFETIKQIFRPFLAKNIDTCSRGYPSAGALYPVEAFVCSLLDSNSWPCPEKILHLLPASKKFEILQGSQDISQLTKAILPAGNSIGTPSHAIIYMMYMPKTIFKYRYRGYRFALMETGSMYILIDLQCKELKIQNRLWSGYTDNMLCKALGLNPTLFYPSCVQFLGGGK